MASANKKRREQFSYLWVLNRKSYCEMCGETGIERDNDGFILRKMRHKHLSIHHLDGNIENNQSENHITLCRPCHDKVEKELLNVPQT